MYCVTSHIILIFALLTYVSSMSILDLLQWNEDASEIEKREESLDTSAPKSCQCDGPSCRCCVDFNMTYIDLGGPGCVQMKYISQNEGIAINVSYGTNLLHSKQVKGSNPAPTCMTLLANLAKVCARLSDLLPYYDGLRGCLLFEPTLLGEVTTSFNIGCFTMGPDGMKLEENVNSTLNKVSQAENINSNETTTESEELNEEELIAAVNESAEHGLVFFGNLLGLTFQKPKLNETNSTAVTSTTDVNIITL